MLKRGDLDLNLIQGCSDSLKEELKQTMLNQELVFMKQVDELHRLYRVQVAVMEDLKQKGLDDCILYRGDMRSIPVNAEYIQPESFDLQHQRHVCPGFMQKPLDLQLPADEFISHCADEFSGERVHRSALQVIGPNNSSQGEAAFGLEKLKLSLGIGHVPGKKRVEHRAWMGKKICASSSNVIDLEDPEFCSPENDTFHGFASNFVAPNIYSKEKYYLESLSQCWTRDVSNGTPRNKSVVDIGPRLFKQASCGSGQNGQHKEFLCADFSSKIQNSTTCRGNNLDLNIVQTEDTSYSSSNHSMVLNISPTRFSYVPNKVYPNSAVANVSHCSETSEMLQKKGVDLNFVVSYKGKDRGKSGKDGKFKEVDGHKISFIDLDSDSDEVLCSSRSNPEIESVGSLSKLSNEHSGNIDVVNEVGTKTGVERNEEPPAPSYPSQNQTTVEPPNCQKLSSSSESDCIINHQSSSSKTMQSDVEFGFVHLSTSDESVKSNLGPPVAHSGEDHQCSDSTGSKIQDIVRNKPKVDEVLQTAAELLIHLSSERAYGSIKASNELKSEEDQPQSSCESYEEMVLKAKGNEPDDLCVSSNAFLVDGSENKEIRYKLKRGSRMKDFQKDILPGLSILSRHEIQEDINIMEGVIRSREYKRMRAKMGDRDDWRKPTRSKRSRVSYNRRYYH